MQVLRRWRDGKYVETRCGYSHTALLGIHWTVKDYLEVVYLMAEEGWQR